MVSTLLLSLMVRPVEAAGSPVYHIAGGMGLYLRRLIHTDIILIHTDIFMDTDDRNMIIILE